MGRRLSLALRLGLVEIRLKKGCCSSNQHKKERSTSYFKAKS